MWMEYTMMITGGCFFDWLAGWVYMYVWDGGWSSTRDAHVVDVGGLILQSSHAVQARV